MRHEKMMNFVRSVRRALDAASPALALGVRLAPSVGTLSSQGLSNLTALTLPADEGGGGVTHITWGVFFMAFQPVDSQLADLVLQVPKGVPYFYEITSWTGRGPRDPDTVAGCQAPKIRVTKEEIWTTALLTRTLYGGQGLSAFNFVYTRPFYDVPCEFDENEPYSEPLFEALGQTRNTTFLECCADQYYRLSPSISPGEESQIGKGRAIPSNQTTSLRYRGHEFLLCALSCCSLVRSGLLLHPLSSGAVVRIVSDCHRLDKGPRSTPQCCRRCYRQTCSTSMTWHVVSIGLIACRQQVGTAPMGDCVFAPSPPSRVHQRRMPQSLLRSTTSRWCRTHLPEHCSLLGSRQTNPSSLMTCGLHGSFRQHLFAKAPTSSHCSSLPTASPLAGVLRVWCRQKHAGTHWQNPCNPVNSVLRLRW
eukprot:m.342611 g.342611  ORF g.342611 m.342611 type:complete len:420 (+) comp20621_c0_seq39:1865-3124(+)